MALYLVQHGKSNSKDIDPDQGLSDEGLADVKRIADIAKGYNVPVAKIKYSVKTRARQTAEIFAAALAPENGIEEIIGIKPMDDVAPVADTLNNDDTMYVGHLPFMEKLTSFLVAGIDHKPVFKFQNGGIVCLDRDAEISSWFIKWTLMPNIG